MVYPLFFLCFGLYSFWWACQAIRTGVLRKPRGAFRWWGEGDIRKEENAIMFWIGVAVGLLGGGFLMSFGVWGIIAGRY
jgi:hypothetical protein